MGSGSGTSLVGILPLLAAGFIFNRIFYITQFRLSKADGQRLFFSCAISGLLIGTCAFALCFALRTHVSTGSSLRSMMDWMHSSIPVPYGLSLIATMLLAFGLGHLANLYLWTRKRFIASDDKRLVKVWAYWRCMPEHISALDELLRRALNSDTLVLLCLKSRKVYCGVVSEMRGNHGSAVAYVQLIPFFSITRDKDTLQFLNNTKTEYRAYSLKRAYERKRTVDAVIQETIAMYQFLRRDQEMRGADKHSEVLEVMQELKQVIRSQIKQRNLIKATLKPYIPDDDFDISTWVKVIPVTEVESASLYKDADYNKWFASAAIVTESVTSVEA